MQRLDMQPCEQKEAIALINAKLDSRDATFSDMKVRQVEIAADVAHVKQRIDNGLSHKVSETHSMLLELKPKIAEHDDLYKRVKDAGWAMAYVFCGIMLCVAGWAVKSGMNIK